MGAPDVQRPVPWAKAVAASSTDAKRADEKDPRHTIMILSSSTIGPRAQDPFPVPQAPSCASAQMAPSLARIEPSLEGMTVLGNPIDELTHSCRDADPGHQSLTSSPPRPTSRAAKP